MNILNNWKRKNCIFNTFFYKQKHVYDYVHVICRRIAQF